MHNATAIITGSANQQSNTPCIRDFYPECSTEIRDRKLTWAEGDFSQYEIQLNA